MRVPRYGFDTWRTLFTNRQLLALGTFVQEIRRLPAARADWPAAWREAVVAILTPTISRLADRGCYAGNLDCNGARTSSAACVHSIRSAHGVGLRRVDVLLPIRAGGFNQAVDWTC